MLFSIITLICRQKCLYSLLPINISHIIFLKVFSDMNRSDCLSRKSFFWETSMSAKLTKQSSKFYSECWMISHDAFTKENKSEHFEIERNLSVNNESKVIKNIFYVPWYIYFKFIFISSHIFPYKIWWRLLIYR